MKNLIVGTALSIAFAASPGVQAGRGGHGHSRTTFTDYARVVRVEPIIREVEVSTPRRECWDEKVRHRTTASHGHPRAAGSMVAGGIIGGVVGHEIGRRIDRGESESVATLLGTLIGASVGHDRSYKRHRDARPERVSYERVCRTVHDYYTEERVEGYHVVYRYKGKTFRTRMDHDPGDRLQVRVSISPTEG